MTVRLERLIITRGSPAFRIRILGGGGVLNRGTLVVTRSIVTESTGRQGGGIANLGTATIVDSLIDHNGEYEGGNIFNVRDAAS